MYPHISQKDVYDFFRQFTRVCSVCGATDWMVTDFDVPAVTLIAAKDGQEYLVPPKEIPCCACICDRCGYVNLHAIGPIEKWIQLQKKSEQEPILD